MTPEVEQKNEEIINLLGKHPEGLSRGQVLEKLCFTINEKTLQRRLASLVDEERIARTGDRKATRYYPLEVSTKTDSGHLKDNLAGIFSPESSGKNVL